MAAKVNLLYEYMQKLTNNQKIVEVNGSTLGQGLNDLVKQFPEIKNALFNKEGKLLHHILVYINKEIASFDPEPLNKPIKDNDEILITLLLPAGG